MCDGLGDMGDAAEDVDERALEIVHRSVGVTHRQRPLGMACHSTGPPLHAALVGLTSRLFVPGCTVLWSLPHCFQEIPVGSKSVVNAVNTEGATNA